MRPILVAVALLIVGSQQALESPGTFVQPYG
jgi:hypothetical protein